MNDIQTHGAVSVQHFLQHAHLLDALVCMIVCLLCCYAPAVVSTALEQVAVTYADACGLKLPIFRTVAAILSGRMTLAQAESHLMDLPLSKERVVSK